MVLLTIVGWIVLGAFVALAIYAAVAMLMLVASVRLAASQEQIPLSTACRERRHADCPGCSCTHHP